jgi:uncharacterized small protein (DUF1192 family)
MAAGPDDEAERPAASAAHQIGQDLSSLSLDELEDRIALLTQEIARLHAAITAKTAHRSAADAVFGTR